MFAMKANFWWQMPAQIPGKSFQHLINILLRKIYVLFQWSYNAKSRFDCLRPFRCKNSFARQWSCQESGCHCDRVVQAVAIVKWDVRWACNFCQLASRNIPPGPLASVLLPTPPPSTWLNDQPSDIMIGCKQNNLRGWFNMMTKISVIDWTSNPSRNIFPCRLTKGGGIQLRKSMCVSSCKYAHNHIFGKKRRRKSVEELRKTPQRKMGSKIYRGGSEEWETKQYCEALLPLRACLQPELPDVTDLRFWSSTKS